MTLWKKEIGDGSGKPNWLSDDEKARCYCDHRGWVLVHLDGTEEVLVAGASLNLDDTADAAQKTAAIAQKTFQTGDIDGDGIRNYQDPDMDGDGVPNETDSDPLDDQVS